MSPKSFRVITPTVGYRGHYKGKVEGKLGRVNVHKAPLSSPVEDLDGFDAALSHDRFANPPTSSGAPSRPGSPQSRASSPFNRNAKSPNTKAKSPAPSSPPKLKQQASYETISTYDTSDVVDPVVAQQEYVPERTKSSPNSHFNLKTQELKERVQKANLASGSPAKRGDLTFSVDSILRDIKRVLVSRCRSNNDIRALLKFAFKFTTTAEGKVCKLADFCAGLEALPMHITVGQITTLCNEFCDEWTGLIDLKQFFKKVAPEITAI